jgi:hypothetical protein
MSLLSSHGQPVARRVRRPDPFCPALRFFGAFSLRDARDAAANVLAAAGHCPRCTRVLAQRFDKLGSTLFYDDDPRALIRVFAAEDRDACTLRLLAACIVVHGRARTEALH